MSYGVDSRDLFRRAGSYVDRVLNGENPGDLPKGIGSRYVSGRTRAWLKTKNPDFERR
jgi:hypothetical protein